MGKAEQDAGPPPLMALGEATLGTPSVRGGLMGCGQAHSSSSSDDWVGREADGGGSK